MQNQIPEVNQASEESYIRYNTGMTVTFKGLKILLPNGYRMQRIIGSLSANIPYRVFSPRPAVLAEIQSINDVKDERVNWARINTQLGATYYIIDNVGTRLYIQNIGKSQSVDTGNASGVIVNLMNGSEGTLENIPQPDGNPWRREQTQLFRTGGTVIVPPTIMGVDVRRLAPHYLSEGMEVDVFSLDPAPNLRSWGQGLSNDIELFESAAINQRELSAEYEREFMSSLILAWPIESERNKVYLKLVRAMQGETTIDVSGQEVTGPPRILSVSNNPRFNEAIFTFGRPITQGPWEIVGSTEGQRGLVGIPEEWMLTAQRGGKRKSKKSRKSRKSKKERKLRKSRK